MSGRDLLLRHTAPAKAKSSRVVRYAVVGLGHIAQVAVLPAFAHARRNSKVAALLTDGAVVLEVEGKFTEAEAMHRQALVMRRKLLGEKHLDVAESLSKLAAVFARQNKLAEAEQALREALAPHRDPLDNADPKLAIMFRDLAIVLRDQGKFSEAAGIYREALPSHLNAWPGDPEQEIRVLADTLFFFFGKTKPR